MVFARPVACRASSHLELWGVDCAARPLWRFLMRRCFCKCQALKILVGVVLAGVGIGVPFKSQAELPPEIIDFSGHRIPSVFDGLNPSRFARYSEPPRGKSTKAGSFLKDGILEGRFGARYLLAQCPECQPIACFGQFDRAVPCYGCCTDPIGCPGLNNYQTDPKNNHEYDQVRDQPCGADCCDDFANCNE